MALDELFPFVVEQCRTRTAGEQIPLLMHCGQPLEALTQIPPDMRLARNPRPAKIEEPAAEADNDGKAKAADAASPMVVEKAPPVAKPVPAAEGADKTGATPVPPSAASGDKVVAAAPKETPVASAFTREDSSAEKAPPAEPPAGDGRTSATPAAGVGGRLANPGSTGVTCRCG